MSQRSVGPVGWLPATQVAAGVASWATLRGAAWRAACLTVGLAACSPTLDWRDVRPPGSGVQLLFPCKPATETRSVALAGQLLKMTMVACQAGGATYALAFADTGDAARLANALIALREAQAGNLRARPQPPAPLRVAGARALPQAERVQLEGQFPDGTAVRQHAGYFAAGTRVYQVAVLGAVVETGAADAFFEGIRVTP